MQKIKKYSAFTLVELIVVIVVLTVLSTVGFVSYSKYIAGSRDTNRIVQLNNISEGLSTLSLTSKLPLPENNINISVGGNIFAYQWDLTEETMDILGYKEWGKYIEITYMLSDNRKYFQLMTFVEDESFAQSSKSLIHSTYAVENKGIYPITIGMPLGILIWKTEEIPVQKIASIANAWIFEINTPSIPVLSYVYEWDYIDSSTDNLSYMILNSSCTRIKQLGKSDGDGEYIISPDSISKINVYCDMTTDEGWWILVARSVLDYTWTDNRFGWNISRGKPDDDTLPYSLGGDINKIPFKDILISSYQEGKKMDVTWKLEDVSQNLISGDWTGVSRESCTLIYPKWGSVDLCNWSNPEIVVWWKVIQENIYLITSKETYIEGLNNKEFTWTSYRTWSYVWAPVAWQPGMIFVR